MIDGDSTALRAHAFQLRFEPDRLRFAIQRVAARVPLSLEKRVG
jgi:hypothetical protein